jgi:hypothetical protein
MGVDVLPAGAKQSQEHRSHSLGATAARRDDTPLRRLQAYLAVFNLGAGRRLPPERELCTEIGVTRAQAARWRNWKPMD